MACFFILIFFKFKKKKKKKKKVKNNNLTTMHRYARNATFQVAILPAKSKADFDSFLKPIIEEVKMLGEKTMLIMNGSQEPIKCKVYVLYVNGDGIECNRLMNFSGHSWYDLQKKKLRIITYTQIFHFSTNGCRFCITTGVHRSDGPPNARRTGMYFIDRKAPLRTKESLLLQDTTSTFVS